MHLTECENCQHYVCLSKALWEQMFDDDKLPKTAERDKKLNFCSMVGKFIRSAILACSIKDTRGNDNFMDLSDLDFKDFETGDS